MSVRFDATEAQLQQIRDAFNNASQIFADATDGQQRFGQITIVNDSGASESAEYWVNAGSGRAYATRGRYGERGQHVMLFIDSNFQANSGANGDAYTIAHEHAHHAFGVLDEYSGPGTGGAGECAPAPDTATTSYCLMDNYFTRGGNGGAGSTYTLNEFCVAGNHDPDSDTWQDSVHAESCWETIGSHPTRAATAPAGTPTDAAPASEAVDFRDGVDGLRVALSLDRSGSMNSQSRIQFARQSGTTFVNQLQVDDGIAVTSFSSNTSVNFPMTLITGPGTQASASTAINGINAGGTTNIGGGLLTALGQITSQTDRTCNEIIVLLSDGDHNTGTNPAAAVPQVQAEGVTVLTVGVGTGISTSGQSTLQSIASQTGGQYFAVASAAELVGLFVRLAQESMGSGLLTRSPEAMTQGDVIQRPVLVETGMESAAFVLALVDPTDDIELLLIDPSGTRITAADATALADVEFKTDGTSLTFNVTGPQAGAWTMEVTAGVVTSGVVEIMAFGQHDGVQIDVSAENSTLTFPEAAVILASPQYEGEAILGATILGTVTAPDGATTAIELFDDGVAPDTIPNDGSYAGDFDNYTVDGSYTVELTLEADGGATTYPGESLFEDRGDPSNERALPPLRRIGEGTIVVQGVPDNRAPTAVGPGDQTVECSDPQATPVTLDGSASSDPDGDALSFAWSASGVSFDDPTLAMAIGGFPQGTTTVRLDISDGLAGDFDEFTVSVVDSTPPSLTATGPSQISVSTCTADPIEVTLPVPEVSDICNDTDLIAEIVAIEGELLSEAIEIDVATSAVHLVPGLYTIQWTATDTAGNERTLDQTVEVSLDNSFSACCDFAHGQEIYGSNYADGIYRMHSSSNYNVHAKGGGDNIALGRGDDCILGGSGGDNISTVAGSDYVLAGSGHDAVASCIWNLGGQLEVHGEAGHDNLTATLCTSATMWGGPGDDQLTGSSQGDDLLVPGSGRDTVYAQGGNDTVVVYDTCELVSGELLDGGPGADTLISPVGLSELVALGISVTGFEEIIVRDNQGYLSDCR